MKKAAILGMGVSGKSALHFLQKRGISTLSIDNKVKEVGIVKEEEVSTLAGYDCLILSPGISFSHPLVKMAKTEGVEVIGEIELAARFLKSYGIGVTGTNGKTTVTLLITQALNDAGMKAYALGNAGTALSSCVDSLKSTDIAVMELSSYQLEALHAPCLDAAIILNITPDHLDRYATIEEYALAKRRIARCLKPGKPLFADPAIHLPEAIPYENPQVHFSNVLGIDAKNAHAAFSICQLFGVSKESFDQTLKQFSKPPHRLDLFATHRSIAFFDDSKATNIDAVVQAVETISQPIHLIAGGVDKKTGYGMWKEVFMGKVKSLHLIGQASTLIANELEGIVPIFQWSTLKEATEAAISHATQGDAVVLSPGCASFDMFTDYSHRGREFKKIVSCCIKARL